MKKGLYIYCIIDTPEQKNFKFMGIHGTEISIITFKDISAVVNKIPMHNFDRFNREELNSYITAHQKVNEEVMKYCDVVPMAFGMMAPDTPSVLYILEQAYFQFKIALQKIRGKTEFVMQARWDQEGLLKDLAKTSEEIQKLRQQLSCKPGDMLEESIKWELGKIIQKEAEIRKKKYIKEIYALLKNISLDVTENKLIENDMLANFSLLIEKAGEPELDKKMQDLGRKYEGKLRFKYIGPMPPYSFVNINLSLGNFELINKARELLGLGEQASFEEIKKAYYALAHQYHPDKSQANQKKAQEQMKKIIQARSILESYCQSCNELIGKKENQSYSFKEKDVKNSLIIK